MKNNLYTYSSVFEKIKNDIYNKYCRGNEHIDSENAFEDILNNYLQSVIPEKIDINKIEIVIKSFVEKIVEHITGDYEIGVGDINISELTDYAETISSIVAYSNEDELSQLLQEKSEELAEGIVDGTVATGLIPSQYEEEAKSNFAISSENIKTFFENSLHNITHFNEKVTDFIAHLSKMDTEESKELNSNIAGKIIGGLPYVLFSGTLMKKRHFTPVNNSKSMLEKIENEGILHFTSPDNIDKIMKSKTIKKSPFLQSDATKKKTFFFAGAPTFEDLVINIPAYDVMSAIRIKPTAEQMQELKYRAINDRAVVKDGDFEFDEEQAEVAYFGLMYDEQKQGIYLGELTQEQAKDFKVSEKVREAYSYNGKKSTLLENLKINAYGFYAEYKHHQKLLQMEAILREKGIRDFRNVSDQSLVELADIEQAYIDTRDKSVERRNLFETIKSKLIKSKSLEKDEREDDEIVH